MEEKVHPLLSPACPEKIKIAILDTGVHLPEGCDLIYQDQIIECRSWLSTTESEGVLFDSNADTDGHGTHATGLLLHLAPHAAIYVARVFEGRNEKQGKEMAAATQKRVAQVRKSILSSPPSSPPFSDHKHDRQSATQLMSGKST
jgi:hypothetical protein